MVFVPVFLLQAIPEDIPLNIVYEDDHLIVVNKVKTMQPQHVHSHQKLPCQLACRATAPTGK
jgi:23S rRNA-/tRNA-specific pseudouridylate synthase